MKKIALYILCLALVSNISFGQNDIKDYFLKNSLNLNDNNSINDSNNLELLKYDAFFLGENHDSKKTTVMEMFFIDILKYKVSNIFYECPVSFYYPIQELMMKPTIDTLSVDFVYATGNIEEEILLRHLYRQNINRADSLKYHLYPIDYVPIPAIDIGNTLWLFRKKPKFGQLKKGYAILIQMQKDSIKYKNKDSLLLKYLHFRDNFEASKPKYKKYLKYNFPEMEKDLNGIYNYYLVKNDDTTGRCFSNFREEFMCENIVDELKESKSDKFISINGAFHTLLKIEESWDFRTWESLASKFKKKNLDTKVCSIYFMDKEVDDLGEDYFPDEKKLIYNNIKPGETYLIRLDGENTPFKYLSEKYQYIVAW